MNTLNLPEPRSDGICAQCKDNDAVTRDGRFCRKCLKLLVEELSPGQTRKYPKEPSGRHLIDWVESNDRSYQRLVLRGSWENGIRAMEGD